MMGSLGIAYFRLGSNSLADLGSCWVVLDNYLVVDNYWDNWIAWDIEGRFDFPIDSYYLETSVYICWSHNCNSSLLVCRFCLVWSNRHLGNRVAESFLLDFDKSHLLHLVVVQNLIRLTGLGEFGNLDDLLHHTHLGNVR